MLSRSFSIAALALASLQSSCGGAAEAPASEVAVRPTPSSTATVEAFSPSRPATIDEPPDPRDRSPDNPTEQAAQAYRLFDGQRFEAAALELKRVVVGETGDNEENKQFAQYRLAISLFELELYQASYGIFSEIADMPTHRRFAESLRWIGRLAGKLPDGADVVERIGKYGEKERALSNDAPHHERFMQLVLLSGRYHVRNRKLEEALALFGAIDDKSQFFVPGQLASAESLLGLRRPGPAADAFGRVEAAIGSGRVTREDARMRELARLGMGSALLSAAVEVDGAGIRVVDDKRLRAAIEVLGRVSPESEYWLDAALEQATAFVLAGEHARAAGVLQSIQAADAPLLPRYEADLRSAAVSFATCRFDEAKATVTKIEAKYEPARKDLEALLSRPAFAGDGGPGAFRELLQQIPGGGESLPASIRELVQSAASDRLLRADFEYLRLLEEEDARLRRMSPAFRQSPLGEDVIDALELAKDIVGQHAGSRGLERFRRLLLFLTPARAPIAEAIKAGAQSNADKAAQARLLQALWQEHVTSSARAADPMRTGRGKRPSLPKSPPAPTVTSQCAK